MIVQQNNLSLLKKMSHSINTEMEKSLRHIVKPKVLQSGKNSKDKN